jgi:hypothetical protein
VRSRQAHVELVHGRILRRTQTGNRIPADISAEALSTAARAVANSDVRENIRVLVKHGVDEADGRLASLKAVHVDAGENGTEHGRGGGGTAATVSITTLDDRDEVAKRSNVGECTTLAVVDTPVGTGRLVQRSGVRLEVELVVGQVALDDILLVFRRREDVGEAGAGAEARGSNLLTSRLDELGRTNADDPWAVADTARSEDVVRQTSAVTLNTEVSRGVENGNTAHAELQPLGTLTTVVVDRLIVLNGAVRDGDDVGGLVDAAHLGLVVAIGMGVRIVRVVLLAIARLAERSRVAVAAVQGIEESVEFTPRLLEMGLVVHVIHLVVDNLLGIDDGEDNVHVKHGLAATKFLGFAYSTIDVLLHRVSAIGNPTKMGLAPIVAVKLDENLRLVLGEESVEILLAPLLAVRLVQTHSIARDRFGVVWDVVNL